MGGLPMLFPKKSRLYLILLPILFPMAVNGKEPKKLDVQIGSDVHTEQMRVAIKEAFPFLYVLVASGSTLCDFPVDQQKISAGIEEAAKNVVVKIADENASVLTAALAFEAKKKFEHDVGSLSEIATPKLQAWCIVMMAEADRLGLKAKTPSAAGIKDINKNMNISEKEPITMEQNETKLELETKLRLEKLVAAEQKRKADEEASKIAAANKAAADKVISDEKEAACRNDLACWADREHPKATAHCIDPVERLAVNSFVWIDGWFEPKFSRYRWKNRSKGVITFVGDKIKFQNSFGASIIHIYECDYDTVGQHVVAVRAEPGRLPK
jgi:hypothetical protein